VVTDGNGFYSTWVPSGWALTFQVLPQGVILIGSQIENVSPLTTGQVFTVPDLVIPCGSRINGYLTGCNGEAIPGTIEIEHNGEVVSFLYSSDGIFSLIGLPNTNYVINCYSNFGTTQMNVTTLAASTTVDVGTIQLCGQIYSTNSFTLTIGAYTNEFISITGYTSAEAQYLQGMNSTTCLTANGYSVLGNTDYLIGFEGTQPVTVDLSSYHPNFEFHIQRNGTDYSPAQGGTNHFIFSLTEFANVGDSIRGTFFGDIIASDSSTGYVSNGHFAFKRIL